MRRRDLRASAPRMMSHITSSMPSEPASRTYSMCGTFDSASGSEMRRSMNADRTLVDQTRARALELVAHAAGSPRSAR